VDLFFGAGFLSSLMRILQVNSDNKHLFISIFAVQGLFGFCCFLKQVLYEPIEQIEKNSERLILITTFKRSTYSNYNEM